MMTSVPQPSIRQFLARTGVHSASKEIILLAVILYGCVELRLAGSSETALYVILCAVPFVAGTGLLTTAKAGQLDILLGAGVSRSSVWRHSALRAVALPLLASVAAALLFRAPRYPAFETGIRAGGIALFTGGLAFVIGFWQPRYAVGVIWIATRLALIFSGVGVRVLAQLKIARTGGAYPPMSDLLISSLAFPELLLDPTAPARYVVMVAAIGAASLSASFVVIRRAEFGGRRSA